jgi:hypothetical protein
VALKVFISYSTKDLHIVQFVQSMLVGAQVEAFVAEYDVAPGAVLAPSIVEKIMECDVFILLWTQNSRSSEWVPQEIGIAKGHNKQIIPVVLQRDLPLPGFIADLKYLDVPRDPQGAFTWLRDNLFARANEKQKQQTLAWFALGGALLWLFSQKG